MNKRSELRHFINTTPGATTETWGLIGFGVSELGIEFNPQTVTNQWITEASSTTEITGYQPSSSVTQYAKFGDPVYDFVNSIRRDRAIGSACVTQMLNIDIYEETEGAYFAEMQEVAISVDSYGGSSEDPLTIGYTIYFRGTPTDGTVTIENGVPTFTAA